MMRAYTGFAEVYDMFMDNVPYEEWCAYLAGLLREYGVAEGIVAELGCGTGRMTRLLRDAGYDMIGIDNSEEMLQVAQEQEWARCGELELGQMQDGGQADGEARGILYLCQDMREFELYGTTAAFVSVCDSMNYILEESELLQVFRLVNNYLDPGGIFVFDMNTIYKYETLLGDATICENREEASFIWENGYDKASQRNEYDLTLFVREEQGLYRKYEETHVQRGYALPDIKRLVEEAGMEFLAVYDAFTKDPPKDTSERVCVVAREKGK